MSSVLAALAITVAGRSVLAAPSPAPDTSPITYEVAPCLSGQNLTALEVTVTFRADADGETRLDLPDAWMGQSKLWRNLSDLTVQGADSVVEEGPAARIVRSRPGRKLVLTYTVNGTLDHEPRQADGYPAAPWVRSSWFYVDGPSAIVEIDGREAAPLRLKWGKTWPKDFALASSLDDGGDRQPRNSVLIGGRDLRIVRAGPVRVALRGAYPFADADLARTLEAILRTERDFFGDAQDTPFLVTAQSLALESGSTFSGTGKHQAFAMTLTPNLSLDEMRVLLAHEIFHNWNPGRLGKVIGPRGYWFSEGFTDFYARRLLQRERLITPAQFVAIWNETLRDYDLSPVKTLTGEQAADRFWTDADKLAYQRGALLAVLWDQRLREVGSSLDAAVRAQAGAFPRRRDVPLVELFADAAAGLGVDVRGDIREHIDQGLPVVLPADAFAPCAQVQQSTRPVFELGFEPRIDAQGVMTVAGLRPGGAAARAGLREGTIVV